MGSPEDGDAVGEKTRVIVGSFEERDSLIQPEQRLAGRVLLDGRLVLDHHDQIVHLRHDLIGDLSQRFVDDVFERVPSIVASSRPIPHGRSVGLSGRSWCSPHAQYDEGVAEGTTTDQGAWDDEVYGWDRDPGIVTDVELIEYEPPRIRLDLRVFVWVLILQFVVGAGVQAWMDSITVDEMDQAVAGVTAVTQLDLRMSTDRPVFPAALAAVAPLLAGVEIPIDDPSWSAGDRVEFSRSFLGANADDERVLTALFRLAPILEGALLGLVLYGIARVLFGEVAGVVAAGTWLTAPVALGFGHLNTSAVPAALALATVLYAIIRLVRQPAPHRFVGLVFATAAAWLVDVGSGVAAAATIAAVVGSWAVVDRTWYLVPAWMAALAAGWGAVWLVYGAFDTGLPAAALEGVSGSGWLETLVSAVPWPSEYETAIQAAFAGGGDSSGFVGGAYSTDPGTTFWLETLLLKLTPIALGAAVAGAVATRWVTDPRRRWRGWLLVGVPLATLTAILAGYDEPAGAASLVPMVAVLALAAGPVASVIRWRGGGTVLVAVGAASVILGWLSVPTSLAYGSPLVGPAWQNSSGSSVDMGQNYWRLADWARDKDAPYVSYYGRRPTPDLAEIEGVHSAHPVGLDGPVLAPRFDAEWIVVSATNLNGVVFTASRPLRLYCPVEVIGGTLLVYRFADLPDGLLVGATAPPGSPAGACDDEDYSRPRGG